MMKNVISVLAWFAVSIGVSELLGYLLHRLLHSGKIGFLSRSHMRHHLVLYGPMRSQRPADGYHDATTGQNRPRQCRPRVAGPRGDASGRFDRASPLPARAGLPSNRVFGWIFDLELRHVQLST